MKRKHGPDGPEEVDLGPGRPRVSEAYSDSSCDSGAMEVQRIHSGLPILPETWNRKAEGAAPPCPHSLTDDSDGREVEHSHVVDRVAKVDGGQAANEALQKEGSPQAFAARSHTCVRQKFEQLIIRFKSRCASSAAESDAVQLAITQSTAAYIAALSKAALQQQLVMLDSDEQALLAELRSMRREYDARVDVLLQNVPRAAGVALSPSQNTIPMSRHPNGMHKLQRSQLVHGTNGWLLSLDSQSLAAAQVVDAGPGLSDADVAAAKGKHAGAAASGRMPPPPPPPASPRWVAPGAKQDRAPKKPPVAIRPTSGAWTTIPSGSQAVAPGVNGARNTEPGLLARPRFVAADPREADAAPSLPPTSVEAGRADPGAVAAAAAAQLQPQRQLPPDVDLLAALLRSGSGGDARVGNLMTQLQQRGRQQQQQSVAVTCGM